MKVLGITLIVALFFSGCAHFQRSEVIDTDKLGGYASGEYRDNSSGPAGRVFLGGSGAGWGGAGGFGLAWMGVETGPPRSGAYEFARAIAMLNYSKNLKSIKYDECGGIIDYEFERHPLTSKRTGYQEYQTKQKLPSSFGYQPVE
jgi:hypothetical protein